MVFIASRENIFVFETKNPTTPGLALFKYSIPQLTASIRLGGFKAGMKEKRARRCNKSALIEDETAMRVFRGTSNRYFA
jgi:hypothetical protein